MKKKIVFIKLGGSLITEKDKPYTAREDIIQKLAREIKNVVSANPEIQFILGTGGGSFAHYPVIKHNLKNGISDESQLIGFCETHEGTSRLNNIVIQQLLLQGVSACCINPSSIFTAHKGSLNTSSLESFYGYISLGIIPVVYGDIIYDEQKGCTIFSTEDTFDILIEDLLSKEYDIDKVIHLTVVDGVLDKNNNIISTITSNNIEEVKQHIYATQGYDVTGGMLHKIDRAISYATHSIKTIITSGEKADWFDCITTNQIHGTSILPS